eukprot:1154464-Pelagomonas_calceolata.AAC.2
MHAAFSAGVDFSLKKEEKNYLGRRNSAYINEGKRRHICSGNCKRPGKIQSGKAQGIVHTRPQLKRIDIISWRGRVFDLRDPLLILLSRKFEPEGAK